MYIWTTRPKDELDANDGWMGWYVLAALCWLFDVVDRVTRWPFEHEDAFTHWLVAIVGVLAAACVASQIGMRYGWLTP